MEKINALKNRELGIYIHIPFCKSKCYYCDFKSFTNKDELIEKYVEYLKKEIRLRLTINDELKEKREENKEKLIISTIYIGGGTPSYIDAKYIKDIINEIKKYSTIKEKAEITIEINPKVIDENKLRTYKEIGINRLSIGLQSANDEILKTIGRIHKNEDFELAVKMANDIGFDNINGDLMINLPNQTIEDIDKSIEELIRLKMKHISVYSLIVEEGTKIQELIEEGKLIKIGDDAKEREYYWYVTKKLERSGYKQYEISNYAKEGYYSRHNVDCWSQKEYLGFGLGAGSYYDNLRTQNQEEFESYFKVIDDIVKEKEKKEIEKEVNNKKEENKNLINKLYQYREYLDEEEKMKDYMIIGFRKTEGISIKDFKEKFAKDVLAVYKEQIERLEQLGLIFLDEEKGRIKPTNRGIDFNNIIAIEFI